MPHCFQLRYVLILLWILLWGWGGKTTALAVDHKVLEDLKDRGEPYSEIPETVYRAVVKKNEHPLRSLREEFRQFVMSSEVAVPTPAESLAWREALRSPVIQQFALEWMTVTWAQAELALRKHPPKTNPLQDRAEAELKATRDAVHEVATALQAGKPISAETQEIIRGGWKPPAQPLTLICAPLIRAVRLLGHLAPETLKETMGIEHAKAELAVHYLKVGTRTGKAPCGNELNEYATDAVRLVWGRRDPRRANVSPLAMMVTVEGSWENHFGDTDIHWNILSSTDEKTSLSFKGVQEEWAARWGLKFKRRRVKGITVR